MAFDFTLPVAYDAARKRRFHRLARQCLKRLADKLGWPPDSYGLRSNPGGIAVSGEITLHHERVYVQVSQSLLGQRCGILIRSCRGRRDYSGGLNRFAALELLDDLPALAQRVREVMER